MKQMRFIPVLLLLIAPAIEGQTKDADKGAMLLSEARRALGGDDRIRAIKSLDVRGDFKRLAGQTTIEGELQIRLELPGRLRRDEDLSLPGGGPAIVRTEVLNGSTVWDENSGGGRMMIMGRLGGGGRDGGGGGRGGAQGGARAGARGQIDPAQLEEAQRRARQTELARFALIWLLATDGEVAWIGTAEAPDGKADVIEITPAAGPVMRLFLDASSHMPLMLTWQGVAPQLMIAGRRGGRGDGQGDAPARGRGAGGPPATLQLTLSDYKTVNGVKLPHLMTRGADDMTIEEWTIDSYRVNPTFGADVFAK
jgi:hypothetical protein